MARMLEEKGLRSQYLRPALATNSTIKKLSKPTSRTHWLLLGALFAIAPVLEVLAQSAVIEYDYDALGRLIQVDTADGHTVEYDHDAAGNRKSFLVSAPSSNSPPIAVNDVSSGTVGTIWFSIVTANDSDPDGDPLTITSVTQPTNGTVTIVSAFVVRISGTQIGGGSFNYTVSDGNGGTATGTVLLTVSEDSGGGGCGFPLCP